jgi:hypothetical protein
MTKSARQRHSGRPWSVPVAVDQVPEIGRHFDLEADAQARAAVAKLAGLDALPRLEAELDVARHGRAGLRVTGRVTATVGQICSVTLDPIENEIDEPIDVVFSPDAAPAVVDDGDEEGGRQVEVTADDGPEPLIDGVVDLGVVAVEFLILGIDPYPRKPGAVFEPQLTGEDTGHPFAALAALKKGQRQ